MRNALSGEPPAKLNKTGVPAMRFVGTDLRSALERANTQVRPFFRKSLG
jgi:hypothetical protein